MFLKCFGGTKIFELCGRCILRKFLSANHLEQSIILKYKKKKWINKINKRWHILIGVVQISAPPKHYIEA